MPRKKNSINSQTDTSQDYIGTFFLDSGAHSLYTREVIKKKHRDGYRFYESQEFWDYVDRYANFVRHNLDCLDYYANVDAIFNPDISWRVLKYLEEKHHLRPVPVIHWNTDLKWLDKHLDAGYDYIGLGGLGQEVTTKEYYRWADQVFQRLCPPPHYLPIVKTHGFAMTGYNLLVRYPWYSTDSASWVKAGGYGIIMVPRWYNGQFDFSRKPYTIAVSSDSPAIKNGEARHYMSCSGKEKESTRRWLDSIGTPFGSVDIEGQEKEWGVVSHHAARKIANLKFFKELMDWLPPWPQPFLRCAKFEHPKPFNFVKPPKSKALSSNKSKRLQQPRIKFFSGSTTFDNTPEHVLSVWRPELPGVMLTYWELEGDGKKGDTIQRFQNHKMRRKAGKRAAV